MQAKSTAQLLEQIELQMRPIIGGHIHLQDEKTKRTWRVNIEPFLMAQFVVTREVYALTGHIHEPHTASQPMTDVSWYDTIDYCNLLSQFAELKACYTIHNADEIEFHPNANGYRLPSEAEWQFACIAGTTAATSELDAIAWYRDNAEESAHPVGQKRANAWGLYDMIGNVWEWCWDVFDPEMYGPYRVFRGGGWLDSASACRPSCRRKSHPTFRIDDLGFRLVRSHP